MRIPCPFCGPRDLSEFTCRGEVRPASGDAYGDLYLRANPAGQTQEHWYHAHGCRRWLTVDRNTRTHVIGGAALAQDRPS